MLPLQSLFGKSPFTALIRHGEVVQECVRLLPALTTAFEKDRFTDVEAIAQQISEQEHRADILKTQIANSLSGTLFLSFDKPLFLSLLEAQDDIADMVEDIAVIMSLRPLTFLTNLTPFFSKFVNLNLEAFQLAFDMVLELPALNESSFSGIEAEKVQLMSLSVGKKEHEADLMQREMIKKLFDYDEQLTPGRFHQWQKILETIGAISDTSEKLALLLRRTVDISRS